MTTFIQDNSQVFMAIPNEGHYHLHDGRTIPIAESLLAPEAMDAYETLKNLIPNMSAYLADKKVSVFRKPDGQYSAWIKGGEVGTSPNPVLALLGACKAAMEHESFSGFDPDPRCIDAMNNLDAAVIRGYHCELALDTSRSGSYYCVVDGEFADWDENPIFALIGGLSL